MSGFPMLLFFHFCAFFVYIALVIAVLNINSRQPLHRVTALIFTCFALLSFCKIFLHNPGTPENIAILFFKIGGIAWCVYPMLALFFTFLITASFNPLSSKFFQASLFLLPGVFIYAYLAGLISNLPVKESYGWYGYGKEDSIWLYAFYGYFGLISIFNIIFTLVIALKTKATEKKQQLMIISVFSFVLFLLLAYFEIVAPKFKLLELDALLGSIFNIYFLIWALGVFYAISRYKFSFSPNKQPLGSLLPKTQNADNILNESEQRFRAAFLTSPDAMVFFRVRDGAFMEVNNSFARLSGYSREEVLGITFPPEKFYVLPQAVMAQIGKTVREGYAENFIFEFIKKDGLIIVINASSSYIELGGEQYVLVCNRDIDEQVKNERKIKESGEKFRAAFFASPDIMVIIRFKDGVLLEVNDAFVKVSGYKREEVVGKQIPGNFYVSPEVVFKEIDKIVRNGSTEDFRFEFIKKNGGIITISASGVPIVLDGEQCVLTCNRDITEKLSSESKIKESEEKFRAIFNSSPFPISLMDLETGIYLDVNDAYYYLYGFTREEMKGKTADEINLSIDHVTLKGFLDLMKRTGHVSGMETKTRKKNGIVMDVSLTSNLVKLQDKPCIVTITVDISERKKMEDALKQSEEKFKAVFQTSPDAMAIFRLSDGVWDLINEAYTTITGYTSGDTFGKIIPPERLYVNPGKVLKAINEVAGGTKAVDFQYEFIKKNGEVMTASSSASSFDLNGEKYLVAVSKDVTEKVKFQIDREKLIKDLQALDMLKRNFIAMVSHEMRTPLTTIKGFTEILAVDSERINAEQKKEYLNIIKENVNRQSALINNLLDMSKMETGSFKICKKPDSLAVPVDEAIESIAPVRGIKIIKDYIKSPETVEIDSYRICQVLMHLLSNSINNSPDGYEINVGILRSQVRKLPGFERFSTVMGEDTEAAMFYVLDHGSGIDNAHLDRLFEPFYQTGGEAALVCKGSGTGLYISKKIVEAHGGVIWAESGGKGKGTKMIFVIPVK